ncbi:hypothetical protein K458DRAFT_123773 [Lentithecium fluviatile CBS 122367]|uniref:Uncharacterized protein n=1 Tax=Lentithecium fluviatile CBS 122367 TaxID=1168545 RepID=A0A6G1JG27_9PLEO|nr:hypothetical protein K458DRAFT_123773 [Lentithecium fluviatile CBS 122367]
MANPPSARIPARRVHEATGTPTDNSSRARHDLQLLSIPVLYKRPSQCSSAQNPSGCGSWLRSGPVSSPPSTRCAAKMRSWVPNPTRRGEKP